MFRITAKKEIAPDVFQFKIDAPKIAKKAKAGQFIIYRIDEKGERTPLTIADSDPSEGTITIVAQAVGKSTKQLAQLGAGDSILNLAGPLGRPTHIENFGTAVCIGGGVGIAPTYPIAKAMKAAGNHLIGIISARSKNLLILEDEMRSVCDELKIATDDGSRGHHGFPTEILQSMIDEGEKIDIVVTVGPVPLMRAVCNVTKPYNIRTIVSLNPIMVDGTGMCGGCRVSVGGETKFVCVDGPEFDGHKVDFDLLVKRQRIYLQEEKSAVDRFIHKGGICHAEDST